MKPAGDTYTDSNGLNDGRAIHHQQPQPARLTELSNLMVQHKIEVPASPTFDFAADGDFSVEFWYKGNAPATATGIIGRNMRKGWYIQL